MIITKKAIPRRTMLRGIGATLALPLLDGMVPPLTALAKTAAKPVVRFGAVYVPNGIHMEDWTPAADGSAFEFTPILSPLEPFRDRLLVVSGLDANRVPSGSHSSGSTKFLTSMPAKRTQGAAEVEAGVSLDQLVAKETGQDTQLASLELGLEPSAFAGACDPGLSCTYTNTIAWRTPTTPLPMENNPRVVFERLFGDSENTDSRTRLARIQRNRSILDGMTQQVAQLQRTLGAADRVRLGQYVEAIRDVERRIQKAEEQSGVELPQVDQPVGIPATFSEHARLMFDLQVLAYQSDLTRVVTFMIAREFSGRSYPESGVADGHHPMSHHERDPEKLAKLTKINTLHMTQFAYFLDKLRSTPDGDGVLLDHVMLLYGSGLSDGNAHLNTNLPMLVAGAGAGQLKGGRHLRFAKGTPLANLHVTLLNKLGVNVARHGDSTGALDLSS